MKNKLFLCCFLVFTIVGSAQSISSSPYSLYGVGSLYESDFGYLPSIGSSGIALPSNTFINNLNPASLGFMPQNHFMFDIGGKAIATTYQNSSKSEKRNNFQFSHLAFAFPVTKSSGFSVTLQPYSSAAFKISNLKIPITDSQEYYYLTAAGSGGLNNLNFSYGYRFGKNVTVGASAALLFGNTVDDRAFLIQNAITTIHKKTDYNGFRGIVGAQFKIDSTLTVGTTFKLPSQIRASKVQSVSVIADEVETSVESDVASDVDDYYMPLEVGFGISKRFKNNLNLTLDYERSFWNDTNQSEWYGDFVNQDRYALGFTYSAKKNIRKYWDRVQYAAGASFDTGYLEVDGKRVNNASLSIGLSLPIENTFTALNISYSYGQKGRIANNLIKENYHKISLNLSLDGIWFLKRKIE
ncbi:aromatic hydrocarbon degradation protein [Flavobacterium foetidum]|uniref:aromatic hydrocarbon degradation protein n=1 Tax=Flavobacterium foetidum TaxID=2026681 RepID=UPI001074E4DE|nr:aromatic hydrocarbon degradation protein [Flavobacterium foetidum]KAF2511919.1 aromatic hydrocarbon degradation protein [Flavobacterium foetidum]